MATLQERLESSVSQTEIDSGKLYQIVQGDNTTVVSTDGGDVNSAAKTIFDLETEINEAGVGWLDLAETAATNAGTAQTAAELAETNAGISETNAGNAQTASETAQGLAETAQTAAELAETNAETAQGLAETAQTASETAQGLAETAQTASETAQGLAETAQTAAELAETNAETAETNAVTAQGLAETAYDDFDDRYLGSKSSDPTLDNDGAALLDGALYWNSVSNEIKVYDLGTTTWMVGVNAPTSGLPARNCALNQDPVTQGTSTRTGMSSTIYTGNGTSQSIDTDVDMSTGDLGGLVWVKERTAPAISSHQLFDTVRGTTKKLSSDLTAIEATEATSLTSFDSTGFSVGAYSAINENTSTVVAWSFQTNQKTTGTTNRNKAYTCHYNDNMGFSIVGYEGDGVDGHEIPHHLGVVPELSIFKNRDSVFNWAVFSSLFADDEYLQLNATDALASGTAGLKSLSTDTTCAVGTHGQLNESTKNIISYHFASVPGVSKIGKYIGTGAAGNYVDCGFGTKKAGFVLVKNLTLGTQHWIISDSIRGDGQDLYPNLSNAEGATQDITFAPGGFYINGTGSAVNELNSEYLFMAFVESDIDPTKSWSDYEYPTTADTLSIVQNTLLSFAEGFNANGQVDTQELVGAGITHQITGKPNAHLWLYKDKGSSYGTTENRPLEGITRNDADKWGEESPLDASLRTTAKHFDYESETGVAAGAYDTGGSYEPWRLFDKRITAWRILSATTSDVQYKGTEKRILKSWRLKESVDQTQSPDRFTIEGSNNGYDWTEIDATYKVTTGVAFDTVANGAALWCDLQSTSGNTTAYLYHRINITENNGHGTTTRIQELELNTILPSDYFLVTEGLMYNSSDAEIDRIYLAELRTNDDSEVSWYRNLPVAKIKGEDAELQGDMTVHGEIKNRGVATAWVNFDGTQNPPLIHDSFNVKDVVDGGTGNYTLIFETPMDSIGYTASFMTEDPVDSDVWVGQNPTNNTRTVNAFGFECIDNGFNAVDQTTVMITIFGGKEIK
ncbi:MAG: hypothetical protein KAS32_23430 [Candidatus Peribacteraceae bacterium]|nr:hypothetical protein [Candidatus Peribacteraceae bacterium]